MDIMEELEKGLLDANGVLDLIYEKFLRGGYAPYEVNISGKQRGMCTVVFNKDDLENELLAKITVVGKAVREIANLLNDSFQRFRKSEICTELWEKSNPNSGIGASSETGGS